MQNRSFKLRFKKCLFTKPYPKQYIKTFLLSMLKLGDDNNVYKKESKNLIYLIYLIYFLMINKKTILLRDIFFKAECIKDSFYSS